MARCSQPMGSFLSLRIIDLLRTTDKRAHKMFAVTNRQYGNSKGKRHLKLVNVTRKLLVVGNSERVIASTEIPDGRLYLA